MNEEVSGVVMGNSRGEKGEIMENNCTSLNTSRDKIEVGIISFSDGRRYPTLG